MGHAYVERLLPDRHALLFQLQGYAASGEPEIRDAVGTASASWSDVRELGGVPENEIWPFFANGMLYNVVAALDLADAPWAREWTMPE